MLGPFTFWEVPFWQLLSLEDLRKLDRLGSFLALSGREEKQNVASDCNGEQGAAQLKTHREAHITVRLPVPELRGCSAALPCQTSTSDLAHTHMRHWSKLLIGYLIALV